MENEATDQPLPDIIGTIHGKTTPYQFKVKLLKPINRTAFLRVEHEEKAQILSVINVWNDSKGLWARVRVIGEIPQTPFQVKTEVFVASAPQIREALGLDVPPEKGLELGKIMNTEVIARPNVEKLGRVFITGKSGSGKSYTVGVLIEELMKKQIPVLIIDRHGEYSSLKILEKANIPDDEPFFQKDDPDRAFAGGIIEFGDPAMNPGVDLDQQYLLASQASDLVAHGQCTIVNLRGLDIPVQEELVNLLLARLYKAATLREIPPFFLFIDEAHLFAGKKSSSVVETIKLFAQEGRKFGANIVVITQKPQALDTTVRAQAGTWIIHKLTDLNDVRITIKSSEGLESSDEEEIQILAPGEAIITGDLAPYTPLRVAVRRRYTVHGGAGYNVLDHVQGDQPFQKVELVSALKERLNDAQLAATGDLLSPQKMSSTASTAQLDALRRENTELKQKVSDLEAAETMVSATVSGEDPRVEGLISQNKALQKELQAVETEAKHLREELLAITEKCKEEEARAKNAIQLAEKALKKVKTYEEMK